MVRSTLGCALWTVVTAAGGCARGHATAPATSPEPVVSASEVAAARPETPSRTRATSDAAPTEVIEFDADEPVDAPTERVIAQPEREPMPSMLQGIRMAPS